MAIIRITINTGNAAFHDERDDREHSGWSPMTREVVRILDEVEDRLVSGADMDAMSLRDRNGNRVGAVEIID